MLLIYTLFGSTIQIIDKIKIKLVVKKINDISIIKNHPPSWLNKIDPNKLQLNIYYLVIDVKCYLNDHM